MELTHLDAEGNAVMVDVSEKDATARRAVACGRIHMNRVCFEAVGGGSVPKGDVLAAARIAGIMATKKTAELIPLCHPLSLTSVTVDLTLLPETCEIEAVCITRCTGRTGVEMEALTGASAALLTVYDMCKALDKSMVIGGIHLMEKEGGKSGHFRFAPEEPKS